MIGAALLTGLAGWLVAERLSLGIVDDAYISLRYADNWASGGGLSFIPEERVEGYSNFLLVVLQAFGCRLGLDGETAMITLGWLSLALLSGVTVVFARVHVFPERRWEPVLIGVVASLNLVQVTWAASGFEACLFAALVLAGVHLVLSGRGGTGVVAAAIIMFLAALTRWEGVALALVLGVALGFVHRSWRLGAGFLVVFGVLFGVYFLVRWGHYGHPLPNTFYAKLDYGSLALIRRGTSYLVDFAVAAPLLVLPAVGSVLVIRRLDPWARVALLVVGVQLAVVVYEGGDHFAMFRFLVPVIPFLSLLLVQAILALSRRANVARRMRDPLAVTVAVLLLAASGAIIGHAPKRDDEEERSHLQRATFETRLAIGWASLGRWFGQSVPSHYSLATIAVGAIGYHSGLTIIDPYGIVDPVIAHGEGAMGEGYAGHEKYDVDHTLNRRPSILFIVNYVTGTPVRQEQLPIKVWGDFNREILESRRFLADYRFEVVRIHPERFLNLHVRNDLPPVRSRCPPPRTPVCRGAPARPPPIPVARDSPLPSSVSGPKPFGSRKLSGRLPKDGYRDGA
jgi:hypothetical protein